MPGFFLMASSEKVMTLWPTVLRLSSSSGRAPCLMARLAMGSGRVAAAILPSTRLFSRMPMSGMGL